MRQIVIPSIVELAEGIQVSMYLKEDLKIWLVIFSCSLWKFACIQ